MRSNTMSEDDCISRRMAIDTLNVDAELLRRILDETDIVGAERAKYEWGLGLIESYISDIEELPSAQPERKRGHWILVHPLQEDDTGACMCSECKVGKWEIDPKSYFFCPSCGADMRGIKEYE